MKWINPGFLALFDGEVNGCFQYNEKDEYSNTGVYILMNNSPRGGWCSKHITPTSELWFSFDVQTGKNMVVFFKTDTGEYRIRLEENQTLTILNAQNDTTLYTSQTSAQIIDTGIHNIEVHIKTGENGRIDIWIDTKLFCSFRSPSALTGAFNEIGVSTSYAGIWKGVARFSAFILQDTRRIGLEKFKKLTINPDTEQNMPQGSTTTYTLSGLSDATEFSDITSVCAVLQATSRDANISTGTFSLEGADVGTIDVSDSSGKAYEIAHAETNSLTGKPWTRDDIEGKTLSFKVNGAS